MGVRAAAFQAVRMRISSSWLCRAMFPYDVALIRVRSQPAESSLHALRVSADAARPANFAHPAYGEDRRCTYGLFSHKL